MDRLAALRPHMCRFVGAASLLLFVAATSPAPADARETAKRFRWRAPLSLYERIKPAPPAPERARPGEKIGAPYEVNGVWYVPARQEDYRETGVASWYGPDFHGRPTANGETFDQHALSAAHTTLPLPSLVRVTNLENGRAMTLRVNDRGPFVDGRIIDVSRAAARELGFISQGTARVRVEYVGAAPREGGASAPRASYASRAVRAVEEGGSGGGGYDRDAMLARDGQLRYPYQLAALTESRLAPPRSSPRAPSPRIEALPPPRAAAPRPAPVSASARESAPVGVFVQAAAFTNRDRAEMLAARIGGPVQVRSARVDGREFHRVLIGPWANRSGAQGARDAVAEMGFPDARIVVHN